MLNLKSNFRAVKFGEGKAPKPLTKGSLFIAKNANRACILFDCHCFLELQANMTDRAEKTVFCST